MSENKEKNAADKSSVDLSHPSAKAGEKESLFKDGEQFIVIPFNRLSGGFTAKLETGSNADSQGEKL